MDNMRVRSQSYYCNAMVDLTIDHSITWADSLEASKPCPDSSEQQPATRACNVAAGQTIGGSQ